MQMFKIASFALLSVAFLTIAQGQYQPPITATWHYQLNGDVELISNSITVDVYIFDLWTISSSTIALMQAKGSKVMCQFSAGYYESWRSDAGSFPSISRGNTVNGDVNTEYLDISDYNGKFSSIMEARMDDAVSKGCDGVVFMNIETYTEGSATTGFSLTATH